MNACEQVLGNLENYNLYFKEKNEQEIDGSIVLEYFEGEITMEVQGLKEPKIYDIVIILELSEKDKKFYEVS